MHCCSILRLAYILFMLVPLISCQVEIQIHNAFPSNLVQSGSITIACGHEMTGIHYIPKSPIVESIRRDSWGRLAVFNNVPNFPVECTVYAGRDEDTDPHQNPTFTAFEPPRVKGAHSSGKYYYVVKEDGVHSYNSEGKKLKFYQPWDWSVAYGVYIDNGFNDNRWVSVDCKFDKLNGIKKVLYSSKKASLLGDGYLYFVVNKSPYEENEIPCKVDWEGRHAKYGEGRYSFSALDKQWIHPNSHAVLGYQFVVLNWNLTDDGIYLQDSMGKIEHKVESWREGKFSRSKLSANQKKTKKTILPRLKFSQKSTYRTETWPNKEFEYCSAFNQKILYCPISQSHLCRRHT